MSLCSECNIVSKTRKERIICDKCRNIKYRKGRLERRISIDKINCNTCHESFDKQLILIDCNRCKECQIEYRKSLQLRRKCRYCLTNSLNPYSSMCGICSRLKTEINDDDLFKAYISKFQTKSSSV